MHSIIFLYSVRDLISGSFGVPMHFLTDIDAVRWFRTQCYSDPVLYHNRQDFALVCLGAFDREAGTATISTSDHSCVILGSTIKQMVIDEQAESTDDFQ
jgi:hypothetical protein